MKLHGTLNAIDCMFGRYYLDIDGLAYVGGEWDAGKYKTYPADEGNIIPRNI